MLPGSLWVPMRAPAALPRAPPTLVTQVTIFSKPSARACWQAAHDSHVVFASHKRCCGDRLSTPFYLMPAVVVNQSGQPVEISSSNGTTFDVPSFYAKALTNNTQNVTVTAYRRGKLYASVTFTLEPDAPPLQIVLPPEFYGIDAIAFRAVNLADPNAPPSEDSTLFALDDLVLTSHTAAAQPPPAAPPPRAPTTSVQGPGGEQFAATLSRQQMAWRCPAADQH